MQKSQLLMMRSLDAISTILIPAIAFAWYLSGNEAAVPVTFAEALYVLLVSASKQALLFVVAIAYELTAVYLLICGYRRLGLQTSYPLLFSLITYAPSEK